jgi:hypothetical protein
VRKTILAGLLASSPFAASAAITPGQEALMRCTVDFQVAYELIVPEPAAGQTERQVVDSLPPERAKTALALAQLLAHSDARMTTGPSKPDTAADKARLDSIDRQETSTLETLVDNAKSDAEVKAVTHQVFDLVDACKALFPDL